MQSVIQVLKAEVLLSPASRMLGPAKLFSVSGGPFSLLAFRTVAVADSKSMIYSLFYDTTRFTFRLDLAQSFDPDIFIQPFDEALGADPVITLTIVFVNTEAARLSSIISFVVALARSPRWAQYVHRARVIYPIPHESQPL